jgi:hypothetical protein
MTVARSFRAFALVALPASAQAQRLGAAPAGDVSLVRVFLALLVCVIAAVLAIFLLRNRISGSAPSFLSRIASDRARIRLVESRRISTQAEVSLVECDGAQYLLLVGAGGSLLLSCTPGAGPAREQ